MDVMKYWKADIGGNDGMMMMIMMVMVIMLLNMAIVLVADYWGGTNKVKYDLPL